MTWRWGIVGPGHIAERFATDLALVEDAALVAVASRSVDRAQAFASRHGAAAAYGSLDQMLSRADVDIVYVATPNSQHAPDTLAALEAGKHVLCEKPLATSAAEATAMIDAARQRGLFLMEAMWTRFLPSYRRLVKLLADGRIGEPQLVEADFGFRATFDPAGRLFDPALGGGATLDLGVYPLQLCSLVLGPPDRVSADVTIGSTGVDETSAAVLHHHAGRLGVVKSSIRIGLSCTGRVSGADGWIDIPAFMHCPTHLDVHARGDTERIDTAHEGDGIRFQVLDVHRHLAAGDTKSTVMPLAESLQIARTVDAIRKGGATTL